MQSHFAAVDVSVNRFKLQFQKDLQRKLDEIADSGDDYGLASSATSDSDDTSCSSSAGSRAVSVTGPDSGDEAGPRDSRIAHNARERARRWRRLRRREKRLKRRRRRRRERLASPRPSNASTEKRTSGASPETNIGSPPSEAKGAVSGIKPEHSLSHNVLPGHGHGQSHSGHHRRPRGSRLGRIGTGSHIQLTPADDLHTQSTSALPAFRQNIKDAFVRDSHRQSFSHGHGRSMAVGAAYRPQTDSVCNGDSSGPATAANGPAGTADHQATIGTVHPDLTQPDVARPVGVARFRSMMTTAEATQVQDSNSFGLVVPEEVTYRRSTTHHSNLSSPKAQEHKRLAGMLPCGHRFSCMHSAPRTYMQFRLWC